MSFQGPEYGCPEPAFIAFDFKAELEHGGIPVGRHDGNPSDVETGLLEEAREEGTPVYIAE
jgi:hypothetical protein